jgi:hypothetical protein
VLWNRTPSPVSYTLPAAMPTATLVDRGGVTQSVAAANGYYTLPLPVATANLISAPDDYIVGGDPLILIETDTISPTSSLAALPAVNIGTAITLTWTASDDASGVWYTEIQSSTSSNGPWATIAGLGETQGVTEIVHYGDHDRTYYFRARARDRVGNWELWPSSSEVSTTVDADTELHWRIDILFNDSNRNGVWDRVVSGTLKPEITLTHVSMRFVDQDWNIITSVISDSWRFTETLLPGTYTFVADWQDPSGDDWVFAEWFELDGKVDPLYAPASPTIGLVPIWVSYLPVVVSNRY